MKKTLLASFAIFTGMFSVVSAASISNVLDGDLYFNDEVAITSGVTYQSDIDEDTGSASVAFEGDGSLTIGKRLGQGFPRVVIYGGITLTVSQDFEGKSESEKTWWAGKVKAPGKVLDIPESLLTWENESNHLLGKTKIATSYGFESATETYEFSPEAYVVLPVEAPDNAKIWYVFHSIDPENFAGATEVEIEENNFCVVKDNLCVIPVTEMNQVALIEESFERCPRSEVPNGSVGAIPYCVITCNRGYELDDSAIACIETEGNDTKSNTETSEQTTETTHESAPTDTSAFAGLSGEDLKKAVEEARLKAIGKETYQSGHYTGDTLQLIDTTNLTGDALRTALRRNAEIARRRGVKNKRAEGDSEEISFLKKALNDIRGTLWSWENQKGDTPSKMVAVEDTTQEMELANGETNFAGDSESYAGHASAPLLPSSGSSTIFIIISILGIGLMLMAFKRN